MVPQKTVSFKCRPMHLKPPMKRQKNKFAGEHHIIWIEKQNIQAKEVYFCKLGQMRRGITTRVCLS